MPDDGDADGDSHDHDGGHRAHTSGHLGISLQCDDRLPALDVERQVDVNSHQHQAQGAGDETE